MINFYLNRIFVSYFLKPWEKTGFNVQKENTINKIILNAGLYLNAVFLSLKDSKSH